MLQISVLVQRGGRLQLFTGILLSNLGQIPPLALLQTCLPIHSVLALETLQTPVFLAPQTAPTPWLQEDNFLGMEG